MGKYESHTSSSSQHPAESHNARRHTRNKKSDPFLELSNEPIAAEQPNPRSPKGEDSDVDQGDSLFVDLVLAPLNMVTFIVSLFLVDRQNRQWRLSQHASGPEPIWNTPWPNFHAEPYQDADSSAWGYKNSDSSFKRPELRERGSFQGWFARKNKSAIAKLEIGDAFEMRSRVAMALIAYTVLGILAFVYVVRRGYIWLMA